VENSLSYVGLDLSVHCANHPIRDARIQSCRRICFTPDVGKDESIQVRPLVNYRSRMHLSFLYGDVQDIAVARSNSNPHSQCNRGRLPAAFFLTHLKGERE
jgi:hypothetical protein